MRVLLTSPPISLTKRLFPRHPPLLMAQTAAVLRNSGFSVECVDAAARVKSLTFVQTRICGFNPDVVFLFTHDVAREVPQQSAAQYVRLLKNVTSAPIYLAGVRISCWVRKFVSTTPQLRAVLLGDPEITCIEIATRHRDKMPWSDQKFVMTADNVAQTSKQDGLMIAQNSKPAILYSLDALPLPAWDLIGLHNYIVLPHRSVSNTPYPLLASRGCPWNRCRFCNDLAAVKSSIYRNRSPDSVFREIQWAVDVFGVKDCLFHDAVFPSQQEWLEEFARLMSRYLPRIRWLAMTRVDRVCEKTLLLMKNAGCRAVSFGLESGSRYMLEKMNKGATLEQAKRAVEWAAKAGLKTMATFIVGFPGETAKDLAETIDFALSLPLDFAQFLVVKWHEEPPEDLHTLGTLYQEWDMPQFDYRGMIFLPVTYPSTFLLKAARVGALTRFALRPKLLYSRFTSLWRKNALKQLYQTVLKLL